MEDYFNIRLFSKIIICRKIEIYDITHYEDMTMKLTDLAEMDKLVLIREKILPTFINEYI